MPTTTASSKTAFIVKRGRTTTRFAHILPAFNLWRVMLGSVLLREDTSVEGGKKVQETRRCFNAGV